MKKILVILLLSFMTRVYAYDGQVISEMHKINSSFDLTVNKYISVVGKPHKNNNEFGLDIIINKNIYEEFSGMFNIDYYDKDNNKILNSFKTFNVKDNNEIINVYDKTNDYDNIAYYIVSIDYDKLKIEKPDLLEYNYVIENDKVDIKIDEDNSLKVDEIISVNLFSKTDKFIKYIAKKGKLDNIEYSIYIDNKSNSKIKFEENDEYYMFIYDLTNYDINKTIDIELNYLYRSNSNSDGILYFNAVNNNEVYMIDYNSNISYVNSEYIGLDNDTNSRKISIDYLNNAVIDKLKKNEQIKPNENVIFMIDISKKGNDASSIVVEDDEINLPTKEKLMMFLFGMIGVVFVIIIVYSVLLKKLGRK